MRMAGLAGYNSPCNSLSRVRLSNCNNVYFAVTDKGAFFQFCDSDSKPIFGFSGISSGAVTAIDYRNQ